MVVSLPSLDDMVMYGKREGKDDDGSAEMRDEG